MRIMGSGKGQRFSTEEGRRRNRSGNKLEGGLTVLMLWGGDVEKKKKEEMRNEKVRKKKKVEKIFL